MLYRIVNRNAATLVIPLVFLSMTVQAPSARALDLHAYFDVEGNDPYRDSELVFSALQSDLLTPNGHGLRNELKKKQSRRLAMSDTSETLEGDVEFHLSAGAKTVFLQYHREDERTLVLFEIGDVRQPSLTNGIARDGVFDIYAIVRLPDDTVETVPFIALPNGSSFHFAVFNDRGLVSLMVNGQIVTRQVGDSPAAYLKFGDYLQAQDPETGKQAEYSGIRGFYRAQGITEDRLIFRHVQYTMD
jgi:hypothetical protein